MSVCLSVCVSVCVFVCAWVGGSRSGRWVVCEWLGGVFWSPSGGNSMAMPRGS